jgi:hypothetical protein
MVRPRERLPAVLGVLTLWVALAVTSMASASAQPVESSIGASADAYVQSDVPSTNFGSSSSLYLDASPVRNTYIRFSVTTVDPATITSATLRLYANKESTKGAEVRSLPTDQWDESTLTSQNAPAVPSTTPVARSGSFAVGWITMDVTAAVQGHGVVDLVLSTPSSTSFNFGSRESTNKPSLVVVGEPAPLANTTPPSVSGVPEVGSLLHASPGTWSGATPIDFAYAWQRCTAQGCGDIPGASGDGYLITSDDQGATLQVLVTATNSTGSSSAVSAQTSAVTVASASDPVIAAAGDIACDPGTSSFNGGLGTSNSCRQLNTSKLLDGVAAVLSLGDNQYYCGGYDAFLRSYDLSWGKYKPITHPVVGNHDYLTSGGTGCTAQNAAAAGYFTYFGAAAGKTGQGYYSFNVGSWHLIALNSNCGDAGGCSSSSPQGQWLTADLKQNTAKCTLAFWHIPRFSSGGRASSNSSNFWNTLYASNADVILDGHDHIYERFAPQTPTGAADPVRGIRQFTVGTGGANHTSLTTTAANSQVRNGSTYGVLTLTLHAGSFDWSFVHEAGATFTDSGSQACH